MVKWMLKFKINYNNNNKKGIHLVKKKKSREER